MDVRSIMSGQRRGVFADAVRFVLWFASFGYRVAVGIRNRQYDTGKREVHDCGVPVISIGNITTGGTGKTPVVCHIARVLRESGKRVAIVSRGYGRGDADENDEALELHSRLPDVPHVQNPDRVEAARVAVEELEAEVILMDDGFQHRRLHRDLNIAVIDATCPFGFGYLLPRGLLREPVENLSRADVFLMTRIDIVTKTSIALITSKLQAIKSDAVIIPCCHRPLRLLRHPAEMRPIDELKDGRVAVICAIGNPDAFLLTVRACGAQIVDSLILPDHDPYSPETVARIRSWVQSLGDQVARVVCTHKDLVKLQTDRLGGRPLDAVLIELEISNNEAALFSAIHPVLNLK